MFSHFSPSVHLKGFDGYLSSYIEAVKATDFRIGLLLDAISAQIGIEWLIFLTTDHGGKGYSHVRYRFHVSLLIMQVSLLMLTNKTNCLSFNHWK